MINYFTDGTLSKVIFVAILTSASLTEILRAPAQDLEIVSNTGHAGIVNRLAFSSDGAQLLSGGYYGTLKLWDIASLKLLRSFPEDGEVEALAFSPDGQRIASGGHSRKITIWDTKTGRLLRQYHEGSGRIKSLAFAPDGTHLMSRNDFDELNVWGPISDYLPLSSSKKTPGSNIAPVGFLPDGGSIFSTGERVQIWDVLSQEVQHDTYANDHAEDAIVLPNGLNLLTVDGEALKVWDVRTGRLVRVFPNDSGGDSISVSRDGNLAAVGGKNKEIRIWEVQSGKLKKVLSGHTGNIRSVAISPDGRLAAASSWDEHDGAIRLWDVETGEPRGIIGGSGPDVLSFALKPDGKQAAFGYSDGTFRLWNIGTNHVIMKHGESVDRISFSQRGDYVFSGGQKSIKMWDLAGRLLKTFQGYETLYSIAISPDNTTMLSGGYGELILWDLATGKVKRRFHPTDVGVISGVAFSHDGKFIVAPKGREVGLWEIASGKQIGSVLKGALNVEMVVLSGGSMAFSTDGQGCGIFWDVTSRRALRALSSNINVERLVFSPDPRMVLLFDREYEGFQLWDAQLGKKIKSFNGGVDAAFFPDGRRVLSRAVDGTFKFWDLSKGELLATHTEFADGEWATITAEGFFDSSDKGAGRLNVVRGLEVHSIDSLYEKLHHPELVQEKLAADPRGLVREAAKGIGVTNAASTNDAPIVSITADAPQAISAMRGEVTVEVDITDTGGGIGKVVWLRDHKPVLMKDPGSVIPSADRTARLRNTLPLQPGENLFEVIAFSARGLSASDPAEALVKFDADCFPGGKCAKEKACGLK
jgi:WD40 repeat protein